MRSIQFNRSVIYSVIIFIGIILRFSSPLVTILDMDSTGYLMPSLNYLMHGYFDHVHARSYPYPLFVSAILVLFKDINMVCFMQHLLGVLSIIILIYTIERLWIRKMQTKFMLYLPFILISLMFWDANTIAFEKMLRPEGVLMPSFICLFASISIYLNKIGSLYNLLIYSISIFLLFFLSVMHARLMAALFFTILILLIHWTIYHKSWIKIGQAIVMTIILGFICVFPENYLIKEYDKITPSFSLSQFFYSNVPAVLKAIDKGIVVESDFDNNIMKRDILITLNNKSDREQFPVLQYNIDNIQYYLAGKELYNYIGNKVSNQMIERKIKLSRIAYAPQIDNKAKEIRGEIESQINFYYFRWFKILLSKYPVEIITKTSRQLFFVLFAENNNFVDLFYTGNFTQCFDSSYDPYYSYLKENLNYHPDEIIKNPAWRIQLFVYRIISIPLRLIFLMSLLWFIFGFFKGTAGKINIILFQIIIIYILTVSLFHSFDFSRYLVSLSPIIYLFIFYSVLNYKRVFLKL